MLSCVLITLWRCFFIFISCRVFVGDNISRGEWSFLVSLWCLYTCRSRCQLVVVVWASWDVLSTLKPWNCCYNTHMDRPMSSHSLSQREGVATATVTTLTQLVQSNWFCSNIQIVTWLASTKHEYNPSYIRNDFCPNTWCTFLICDIFQKYMVNMFHGINNRTYIHIFLIFHRFFFFSSCLTFSFLGNSFEKK